MLAQFARPLPAKPLKGVESDLEASQPCERVGPDPPKARITPDPRLIMCRAAALVVKKWVRIALVIG